MTDQILKVKDPNIPIDDDRNRNLHIAAARGDEALVKKEIQRGAKVDIENYLGWTPLMMAVRNGHYKVTSFLLQHRADATRKNKFGVSVFHISIATGNEQLILLILDFLLKGGVSKLSMENVLSPLSLAILFHNNSILKSLVCKSFNVNTSTPLTALTPMMFAAALNNMAAYQLLLSNGANVNLRSINQQTAQDMLPNNNNNNISKNKTPNQNAPTYFTTNPTKNDQNLYAPPVEPRPKKSSNIISPATFFISPHLSPVTPLPFPHQVFFPADFSYGQMLSPAPGAVGVCHPSPEVFYQFASPQQFPGAAYAVPVYSPCLNDRISPHNISCNNSVGYFDEYGVNNLACNNGRM